MKTKRISKDTAAQSAASVEPSIEAQTLKAPADSVNAPTFKIPEDITDKTARRAYALAYRRTMDGRKLDFMPPRLIPALCRGIAAAFWLMQKAGQAIETATAARN